MLSTAQPDASTHDGHEAQIGFLSLFSDRLNRALDARGFPSVNAGRFSALGAKYGTSRQQAGRWCSGQAIPAPQTLIQMAIDLRTSVDFLLGRDAVVADGGIEVPVFRLQSKDVEAVQSNFQEVGSVRFPPQSPVGGRRYAICQNWAESLDPPFGLGEDLLIDLSIQELEDECIYVIRTSASTSVRRFRLINDGALLNFTRTTPINKYAFTYKLHEVNYNAEQRFDADWRQPGCIVLGRVEASMRTLVHGLPSFLSGQAWS